MPFRRPSLEEQEQEEQSAPVVVKRGQGLSTYLLTRLFADLRVDLPERIITAWQVEEEYMTYE